MICRHVRARHNWTPMCPTCGAPITVCDDCHGGGLVARLNYDTCPTCHGSGIVATATEQASEEPEKK